MPSINPSTNEQYTWRDLGIEPDVCIWLNPWPKFRGDFAIQNLRLSVLNTYIPYGYLIANNEDNSFKESHFNQISLLMMWKIFYETTISVEMSEKYCYIGDTASVYTGYPKMDIFYDDYPLEKSIWKKIIDKNGNTDAKKIIYAPHHTIEDWEPIHFSTFKENYRFMLYLAKKYSDSTQWIFRPHPALRDKAIRAKIFSNEEEWNDYVREWDKLDNAISYFDGEYADMMLNSDAMIMDSGSFVVEYSFSGNPLLFLDSGRAYFNEFGNKVMEVNYKVPGIDYEGIEEFINEIVLRGKDYKKMDRKVLFDTYVDYKQLLGGKSAAENIYRFIEQEIG